MTGSNLHMVFGIGKPFSLYRTFTWSNCRNFSSEPYCDIGEKKCQDRIVTLWQDNAILGRSYIPFKVFFCPRRTLQCTVGQTIDQNYANNQRIEFFWRKKLRQFNIAFKSIFNSFLFIQNVDLQHQNDKKLHAVQQCWGSRSVHTMCLSPCQATTLHYSVTSALHISHLNKGCTSVLRTCLKCIFLYFESFDFIRSYEIVRSQKGR